MAIGSWAGCAAGGLSAVRAAGRPREVRPADRHPPRGLARARGVLDHLRPQAASEPAEGGASLDQLVAISFANLGKNVARFRLYRHRSLQVNTRFAAFFKIYQII